MAKQACRRALVLNPDDEVSKSSLRSVKQVESVLAQARKTSDMHDFDNCVLLYIDLLSTLPVNSKLKVDLMAELSEVYFRADRIEDALQQSLTTLAVKGDHLKGLFLNHTCEAN